MTMTSLGALPMYVAVPILLIGTCFSSIGAFLLLIYLGWYIVKKFFVRYAAPAEQASK
jgi:hypothetical protein